LKEKNANLTLSGKQVTETPGKDAVPKPNVNA
jgi:hypothetical protein